MKKIFEYIRQETAAGHDLVLASIISQEGSSPRGLGAQMLVGAEGRLCGTVGGGAVYPLWTKGSRGKAVL